MALDRTAIKSIAYLARLRVEDAQCDALAGELSGILHWVEQLAEVDTNGIEPMTSVAGATLAQRPDAVTDGGNLAAALSNAPSPVDDYYAVPKVVE